MGNSAMELALRECKEKMARRDRSRDKDVPVKMAAQRLRGDQIDEEKIREKRRMILAAQVAARETFRR